MDYNKHISNRARNMKQSGIRKFFDLASKMKDVISLGVGEPDFITAPDIRQSAITSLQKGYTQYTSNSGILKLRQDISEYLNVRYGLSYDPEDEVVVTVGASEGIDLSLRALIDEGDEILVPEPSYVSYSPCVEIAGGVAVPLLCTFENQFKVTAEEIEKAITDKTKALILPYPNNPTGAILEREELEKIAKIIIEKDIICISDEIYSELTYGVPHISIASLDGMRERTIVLNGFSKSFAMTGFRIGYLTAPRELVHPIYTIHQYAIMCCSTMSQHAAMKALEMSFETNFELVEEMRDQYNIRRKFLYKFFTSVGMDILEPKGAFYVFPSTKKFNMTGDEFAEKLLESKGVAVIPGSAFGSSGKYHIRISYAYSMESLQRATKRIAEFIEEIK